MARYRLQTASGDPDKFHREWKDTDITFNTKQQLDEFIGEYKQDYEWRSGFMFQRFGKQISRFVWDTPSKKGEDVKC